MVFNNVPYGDYQIVEVQALDTYVLDSTPIDVQVRENGATIEKTSTNVMKKSTVVLTKTDKRSGVALEGVTFELRSKDDNKLINTVVTNGQGKAIFNKVPYGDYVLVETKAKAGYILDKTPIEVQVREDGATIEKFATNTKKPILRKLPATGVNDSLLTSLVALLFGGCVFGLVGRRRCE